MSSPKPLFSFGIISDIQYADVPDGHNFSRTKTRYYRNGISVIEAAGRIWANHSPPVDFIVDLGDLVDGKAKLVCSESALNAVLAAFNALHKPVYHTWGNHEFYNFSRTALMQSEIFSGNMPQASGPKGKAYYTIQPHPKLLIVSLDGYETSVLGYDKSEMPYQQAMKILAAHNPNEDKNSPDGISGEERRYMAYNGGLGTEQVNWLKDTLTRAEQDGVNVVIIGHIPALASTAGWSEVLWNYDEVLSLLGRYRDCVACFIAGHYHETGFDVDDNGIPHMTMPGVIESPPGQTDCCSVDVYTDQLDFQGQGRAHSCKIPLAFPLR